MDSELGRNLPQFRILPNSSFRLVNYLDQMSSFTKLVKIQTFRLVNYLDQMSSFIKMNSFSFSFRLIWMELRLG